MNTDYTLLEFILCVVIVCKKIETYNLITAFIRSRMVSLTLLRRVHILYQSNCHLTKINKSMVSKAIPTMEWIWTVLKL